MTIGSVRVARGAMVACALGWACFAVSARADWGTYQGNARHDGYVGGSYDPAAFHLAWSTTIPGSGGNSWALNRPAIGAGKVFVSRGYFFVTGQPNFFALNDTNGSVAWTKTYTRAGSPGEGVFSVNEPAYANGRVYLATGNHQGDTWLYSYDAGTGQQAFRSPMGAQWERYLAPTIVDNVAYLNAGGYGGMYAFDATGGQQQWFNSSLPQYDLWTPAVSGAYAYAYLGSYAPALYVVNRASGQTAYSISDPDFSWSGWSMNNAVVLGARDNAIVLNDGLSEPDRLISFDLTSRTIAWAREGLFTSLQPTVSNGQVFVISGSTVQARSEETGNVLWDWNAGAGVALSGTILATEDLLFVGSGSRTYAVDRATHARVWDYPLGGALALDAGALYITSPAGTIAKIALPEPGAPIALVACAGALLARRHRSP